MAKPGARNNDTTAHLGCEGKLWASAEALRNNMDAAEYKHVVLGLIFIQVHLRRLRGTARQTWDGATSGGRSRRPDEYRGAERLIFWVPPEVRWQHGSPAAGQCVVQERYAARSLLA